jgi:hypothetical protein
MLLVKKVKDKYSRLSKMFNILADCDSMILFAKLRRREKREISRIMSA